MDAGRVYLIGAGPGDPELIPLKGIKALKKADVILYDRLVSIQLLKYAKPGARFIYCGKEAGHHTKTQEEINQLIVEEAKRDYCVVRLKGGDPSIFGRVGEEAEACVREHVPFDIIPGVTSGIAAATYAGIPLTHREYGSNVAFISGHRCASNETERNWAAIAGLDTLVVYMGVQELPQIRQELLAHGKSATTPAALVRWATTGDQQTCTGTLDNIADKAREMNFRAPAILIVGEVVNLRDLLNWYEPKPLFGRRLLVFGNSEQAEAGLEELTDRGAEVIEVPVRWSGHAHISAAQSKGSVDWNIFAEYMKEAVRGRPFHTLWIASLEGLEALQHAATIREDWAAQLRSVSELFCTGEEIAAKAKALGWHVTLTAGKNESPVVVFQNWLSQVKFYESALERRQSVAN